VFLKEYKHADSSLRKQDAALLVGLDILALTVRTENGAKDGI
jgi:hypothetical protein